MAQAAPASAACVVPAGTADGLDKETAVSRAQRVLDDHIQQTWPRIISRRSPSAPCAQNRSLVGAQGEREHDIPP